MAKGLARSAAGIWVTGLLFLCGACSQSKDGSAPFDGQDSTPLSFPLSASLLKNCRFETPNPVYTLGRAIAPNPVICDEGAVKSVSVLTATPLPNGLSFSQSQMSLIGTPAEKIPATQYQFYLENEAGYLILKMHLTVK